MEGKKVLHFYQEKWIHICIISWRMYFLYYDVMPSLFWINYPIFLLRFAFLSIVIFPTLRRIAHMRAYARAQHANCVSVCWLAEAGGGFLFNPSSFSIRMRFGDFVGDLWADDHLLSILFPNIFNQARELLI